jgi:hypothetical protein
MASDNITSTNLYPPIVDTYQPISLLKESNQAGKVVEIFFRISSYMEKSNDLRVEVSFKRQKTNENILTIDAQSKSYTVTNENSIKIPFEDFISETLSINEYYKIQLRFKQGSSYSEWSTVSLKRFLSEPQLKAKNLEQNINESLELSSDTLSFLAELSFSDKNETDTLNSYQLYLYKGQKTKKPESEEDLYEKSSLLYTNAYNNINEINYTFSKMLEDGVTFTLFLDYTTKSGYKNTSNYIFLVNQPVISTGYQLKIEVDRATTANTYPHSGIEKVEMFLDENVEDEGYIKINISGSCDDWTDKFVQLRRTSSKSNFSKWEDFWSLPFSSNIIKTSYLDFTIESGVFYKYGIQLRDSNNKRSLLLQDDQERVKIFHDILLRDNESQLKIKYDAKITSYKRTVSESKTETIGSQFPFVKRNGAINYRQFSLSGLITLHSDYFENFVTRQEGLYGGEDIEQLYLNYNNANNINDYNDVILEKLYREKVLDFLYKDNVKMLRTFTEGNFLVKLMDISLTPKDQLHRMVYSFTATAYEIDDFTLDNLVSYGIISNEVQEEEDDSEQVVLNSKIVSSFLEEQTVNTQTDIVKILKEKYSAKKTDLTKDESNSTYYAFDSLNNISFHFSSEPYLVSFSNEEVSVAENTGKDTLLGYIVTLDDKNVFINSFGVLQVEGDFHSITFPKESQVEIFYNVTLKETQKQNKSFYTYNSSKFGQVWKVFSCNQDFITQNLANKYYRKKEDWRQQLIAVSAVSLYADVGTTFEIQTSEADEVSTIVLDKTEEIHFKDSSLVIKNLLLRGVTLYPEEIGRLVPRKGFYYKNNEKYNTIADINKPVFNTIYFVGEEQKIYYLGQFYDCEIDEAKENTCLVKCPVEVVFNYYCEVEKKAFSS